MPYRERLNTTARDQAGRLTKPDALPARPQFPQPRSKSFSSVLYRLRRFAADDSVMIVFEGESGTGKSWLARHVHSISPRAAREPKEISLATIIDSLASSELFGHEAGAFTDGRHRRSGAFQSANHSTLFIDEVGKASPEVQRLLLRAVEERVIRSVGSDRDIEVDVRLLFATNLNLPSLVAEHHFLPDLFARLGHFRIQIPPLRERREDIPDLARYLLALHARRYDYSPGLPKIHPELMDALTKAEWKYNLRDLDGALHCIIVEGDSSAVLTLEHCVGVLDYLRADAKGRSVKASRQKVAAAIRQEPSIASAARALGISRSTVYRKLARQAVVEASATVADLPARE